MANCTSCGRASGRTLVLTYNAGVVWDARFGEARPLDSLTEQVEAARGSSPHRTFPSHRRREERVIALCRVLLLGLASLALAGPLAGSALPPAWVVTLLHLYLVLAAVYALTVWSARRLPLWLRPATHAVDLGYFAALAFASEGTASPLFVLVLFALVTATLRWQWRGIAWTGGIALAVYVLAGARAIWILEDPGFDAMRFVIRVSCLLVLTLVLVFLGRNYRAGQLDLVNLSRWPRTTPETLEQLLEQVLPHAAAMLGAKRTAFLWHQDSWTHVEVSEWRAGERTPKRRLSIVPGSEVATALRSKAFLWSSNGGPGLAVFEEDGELRQVSGASLDPGLASELGLDHAVVLPIDATALTGLLIVSGDAPPKSDRLHLGQLMATMLSAQIDQVTLHRRLRRSARDRERTRIARDVHDSVAQALAVLGLRLHSAGSAVEADPGRARQLLSEAQELLGESQSELRVLTDASGRVVEDRTLVAQVVSATQFVERSYGIPVRLELSQAEFEVSPGLAREASQLVREAATNAARHAGAGEIAIALEASASEVRLRIRDDGHGLTFTGRRELAALIANDEGPRAIRERVEDLGGNLVIESSAAGTVLEISLPIREDGA